MEKSSTFKQFTDEVAGRIQKPYSRNWKLYFHITDDSPCQLNGDSDYLNMLRVCAFQNRPLIHVTLVMAESNTPPSLRHKKLTNYFPATKNRNSMHRFTFDLNAPPQTPSRTESQSFGESINEVLCDPIVSQPPQKKKTSKRKARESQIRRGDFFDGASTDYPVYDIAPQQEPIVLRSANWVNYIKSIGQEFIGGVVEFRSKLVMYAAKLGFKFIYTRNDAIYVRARCALHQEDGCKWFVKGSRLGCRIIGNLITDAIRANPTLSPTDLKQEFQTYYGFTVPYDKIWRGVEVARGNIFGTYADSFDELRWYSQAIIRTNPGSKVFLETTPNEDRFHRFFLAFHASLEGFKKCRPMLFVDGTFMKTRYKGTLLAATAKDGNNGLFPVAIAIVDGENSANWYWFINKLKEHVQHEKEIIISEQCIKGRNTDIYKSSMCKLLKDAAYAPNKIFYEAAINKFKLKGGPEALHFLNELPPEKWAVSFAPDVLRYGELTSNAAESFNSWILDARCLPVTFMLDCICMKLMKWFTERREQAKKWTGALTASAEAKWNEYDSVGESWNIANTNQEGVYEVLSPTSCVVNLNSKTCSCYQWQIRGFPCAHAIGVIKRSRWPIRLLVDSCFFVDTYKAIYQENIFPVPNTEKFEFIDLNGPDYIHPPILRRQLGRPRNKRFRVDSQGKKREQFICGRCGEYGNHYWTTCKDALDD